MSKRFFSLFLLLAMLLTTTSMALAAPADAKKVELVSVTYERTGIILTFKTSGLTKDDLKGATFEALSTTKSISCDLLDDGETVRCSVSKGLGGQGGFKVTIAGFVFWGDLPAVREVGCPPGEYPSYYVNFYDNGLYITSWTITIESWNWLAAHGYFELWASKGYSYSITGETCSPNLPV